MPPKPGTHFWRRSTLFTAVLACLATGLVGVQTASPAAAAPASDPASLEAQLLSLIQQDRWQHGEPGLVSNATLAGFSRGTPHQACGGPVIHGRAEDMIERNYFSHQVPPCGAYIFPAIQAVGLPMTSWAENIAWSSGSGSASPGIVNSGFMASPEHRANILGDFNSIGVGAWSAAGPWSGAGAPRTGVIVFVVLFAHVPGVVGPVGPAPPPPPPRVSAAVAPAPPAPPPPPPSQPAPDSTSWVLGHSGHAAPPPTVRLGLAAAPTGAAVGPRFLARVTGLMLLGLVALVAMVVMAPGSVLTRQWLARQWVRLR